MPIVDLTRPFDASVAGFSSVPAKTLDQDGWNASTLTFYSHAGTHMDAPNHFLDGEPSLENLSLESCLGPARCIDLGTADPDSVLEKETLEAAAGSIQPGERLLLRSRWSLQHGKPDYRDAMPGLSPQTARWLASIPIALIGVEPPSVARVTHYPELKAVHEILLGARITLVEGLINLDQLPTGHPFQLAALPLKITGGDGCPARVVAWW